MRAKSSLSPYPILNNYGDDYISSSLTVDYDVTTQFREVYGKLTFRLDNEDIMKLIDDKAAQYVVHIESPSTCFRQVIKSFDPEVEFRIDSVKISKMIEIRTFIMLVRDVKDFTSPKFDPFYKGMSFNIGAHQIIAVGSAMDFNVVKDDRDLESIPSIIQISRLSGKKKGSITVNTENASHIIIGLTDDVFEQYCKLGKSTFRDTAFSVVLMPALVVVLQRMYQNKDDAVVTSLHWYKVIESMLEKNGHSIENLDVATDNLLMICQAVFADPIARSLAELDRRAERLA